MQAGFVTGLTGGYPPCQSFDAQVKCCGIGGETSLRTLNKVTEQHLHANRKPCVSRSVRRANVIVTEYYRWNKGGSLMME